MSNVDVFLFESVYFPEIYLSIFRKIHNYNLHSPLRQIQKAKAYELDYILFKIIKDVCYFIVIYILIPL